MFEQSKPFVTLHPSGIFSVNPELLKAKSLKNLPEHTLPISDQHKLLVYLSLLETTKPFLCNCISVGSAHTLLLISQLDTNKDFTR